MGELDRFFRGDPHSGRTPDLRAPAYDYDREAEDGGGAAASRRRRYREKRRQIQAERRRVQAAADAANLLTAPAREGRREKRQAVSDEYLATQMDRFAPRSGGMLSGPSVITEAPAAPAPTSAPRADGGGGMLSSLFSKANAAPGPPPGPGPMPPPAPTATPRGLPVPKTRPSGPPAQGPSGSMFAGPDPYTSLGALAGGAAQTAPTEAQEQDIVTRSIATNPPGAVSMIAQLTSALLKPAVSTEEMAQQQHSRRGMALLLAGLATVAEASKPGATPLGALAGGAMAGLGQLERMKDKDAAANAAKDKARLDKVKELRALSKDQRDFALEEAKHLEKVRSNTATEAETRDYHTKKFASDAAIAKFKAGNVNGIKGQQEWFDLAQDQARTDESSYKRGAGGELEMVSDLLTGGKKPVIDPKAYEANVRKYGSALNREHGLSFKYIPSASPSVEAPPVPGAVSPSSGGSDPLGLRG